MLLTISVIIPAFNAAETLTEQLTALARQTYQEPFEIVVADNGSTDSTRQIAESFRQQHPSLKVVDASRRRGAGPARNIGAEAAVGRYLAFCDADDKVAPDWLEAMSRALQEHEFVTGSIDHDTLNPGSGASHWKSHISSLPLALRFMPYALSGNMAVSRDAFEEVRGFPENLGSVGEDVAFSWQLQLAGHELYFEQEAVVAYRHRHDPRMLWRQHQAFGLADAVLYKRFRAQGVPPPRILSVLAAYVRLLLRLPSLLSPQARPAVIRALAKRWGRLRGSIREGVFYL